MFIKLTIYNPNPTPQTHLMCNLQMIATKTKGKQYNCGTSNPHLAPTVDTYRSNQYNDPKSTLIGLNRVIEGKGKT